MIDGLNAFKEEHYRKTKAAESHFAPLEALGEGITCDVILAQDKQLLRKVAVKKVKNQISRNQFLLDSFITEAQVTAQLEHPCIIPIYGLEINPKGDVSYSMKRIEGHTLTELIQNAQEQYQQSGQTDQEHNLNALLEHFLKVADAVEYAHQKGIIHRDLKPDNIMIGPYNEVYILDWGIARPMSEPPPNMDEKTLVTISKTADDFNRFEGHDIYGTPCYMSPEQAAGGNAFLNGQSDLYSLGLILFEITSLKPAYDTEENFYQTLNNSVDGKIKPLVPYHPHLEIPRELSAIIQKATQRVRKDRYKNVKELSDEIRRYLRGEAVLAQPDTFSQKLQRWISQNREKTLVFILSIILLSASIIAWSFYKRHTDHLAAQHREQTQVQFLNLIRDKSQELNRQFLSIAGLTQEFAAGIEQLLGSQAQQQSPLYTFEMGQKGIQPPDTTESGLYPSSVSLNHFVFKKAKGVTQAEVAPLMQKIAPYGPFMKQLLLLSHGDPYLQADSPEGQELLLNQGVLAIHTYAGFEEGFGFSYPRAITKPNYDSRQRPWYQIAKNTRGVQWGQAYLDSAGLGWMIPCTKALYDVEGVFKGVVGVDLKLSQLAQKIKIAQPYIKDVYLLNNKGEILIQGSVKAKSTQDGKLVNTLENLNLFPQNQVVKAIQNKVPSGYLQAGPEKTIYSYQHLSSTEWYFLVEADSQKLYQEP